MKCKALGIDLTVFEVDLNEQDLEDLKTEDASFLDFDCHHIFLEEAEWEEFKAKVNQL